MRDTADTPPDGRLLERLRAERAERNSTMDQVEWTGPYEAFDQEGDYGGWPVALASDTRPEELPVSSSETEHALPETDNAPTGGIDQAGQDDSGGRPVALASDTRPEEIPATVFETEHAPPETDDAPTDGGDETGRDTSNDTEAETAAHEMAPVMVGEELEGSPLDSAYDQPAHSDAGETATVKPRLKERLLSPTGAAPTDPDADSVTTNTSADDAVPANDSVDAEAGASLHRDTFGDVEPDPQPPAHRERQALRALRAERPVGANRRERADTKPGNVAGEDRPIIAAPAPSRRIPSTVSLRADRPITERRDPRPAERSRRRSRGAARRRGEDGAQLRRHPRIEGGGTVVIAGTLYPLGDWSPGGIAIASHSQSFRLGDTKLLELELDLGDYAVNLDIMGTVVNRNADKTGWQFIGPSGAQQGVLLALSKAALGEAAFLEPPSQKAMANTRDQHGPARKARGSRRRRTARRRLSDVAGPLAFAFNVVPILLVAGVVILTNAISDGTLLFADRSSAPPPSLTSPQDLALFGPPLPGALQALAQGAQDARTARDAAGNPPQSLAVDAVVVADRIALLPEVSGVILAWQVSPGGIVAQGDPLATLRLDEDGELVAELESPCACMLARILAGPGTFVGSGQPAALFVASDATGGVQALFPRDSAPLLGETFTILVPATGETVTGTVEALGDDVNPRTVIGFEPETLRREGESVLARLVTEPALPAALAGDDVILSPQRKPSPAPLPAQEPQEGSETLGAAAAASTTAQ
ncbi:MAG: hypothetical protein AAGJ94_06290 [Pseudomonadota bacterium]